MLRDDETLYLCIDARPTAAEFAARVDAAFRGGVDIIQLRDKVIDVRTELSRLEILQGVAEQHGKRWAVNDRADVALIAGAPVFHVGQDDLPVEEARRLLGSEALIGLSTHDPAQATAAAHRPDLSYFCVGPLWQTPTKPGRAATGLDLVAHAAALTASLPDAPPWFAIGGIDHQNIDSVVAAGARRVVVVRAIADADDPEAAARTLKARL
ncbi:thiamine phosphate synthase [Microbacterium sp. C23T]